MTLLNTLWDEYNVVISIDESNRLATSEMRTPLKGQVGKKGATAVLLVAPSPSDSAESSVSSGPSMSSDDEQSSDVGKIPPVSEHKIAEMRGLHSGEPSLFILLRPSPNSLTQLPPPTSPAV